MKQYENNVVEEILMQVLGECPAQLSFLDQSVIDLDGDDYFLQAARYDDLNDVKSLASSGVFLDSKDSLGRTGYEFTFCLNLDILNYLIYGHITLLLIAVNVDTRRHKFNISSLEKWMSLYAFLSYFSFYSFVEWRNLQEFSYWCMN